MSRQTLTTSGLIKTILRRASIPTDQSTFTDEDLIEIMNEEMGMNVVPVVLKVHEEYYVTYEDQPIVSERITIPYRAIGNRLRDVAYLDSSGTVYNMTRVAHEDISDFESPYDTMSSYAFYVENDELVLLNGSNVLGGTVRLYYYVRPNQLVDDSEVATIQSINRTTGEIVLSLIPTGFSPGVLLDFIGTKSPNKIKAMDIEMSAINNNTKTITVDVDSIPSKLIVGDFIALAENTHVPQIPSDLIPILVQRVAVKCLESMGDSEGVANAQRDLDKMELNAYTLIDNRVEGAPRKVVNRTSQLKTNNVFLGRRRGF